MANESDYESDAVRKTVVRKKKKNKSHKSRRLNHGSVAQIWATGLLIFFYLRINVFLNYYYNYC